MTSLPVSWGRCYDVTSGLHEPAVMTSFWGSAVISRQLSGNSRWPSGHLPTAFRKLTDSFPEISDNLPEIYRRLSGNPPTTLRKFSDREDLVGEWGELWRPFFCSTKFLNQIINQIVSNFSSPCGSLPARAGCDEKTEDFRRDWLLRGSLPMWDASFTVLRMRDL